MMIRTLVVAAYAALALATISPAFAHDVGDKVTPNFEQAIPNIPGKSLITVVVDYPPGAASRPHAHPRPLLWASRNGDSVLVRKANAAAN
jgi:quercetin dioxygenase-like cupin family protein